MTIEDGHLDIDRGPKDPHTGPDSVEKFSYDYALSESATDRLHDLVVVEKEGLQRRVEELEGAARGLTSRLETVAAMAERAETEAAEQRRRAEEAEAEIARREAAWAEEVRCLRVRATALIAQARQEERERCAEFVEESAPSVPEGPMGDAVHERFRLVAEAIRNLASEPVDAPTS